MASILAAAVFLAASVIGSLILALVRGRGSGDIPAFLFWSVPAAGVIAVAVRLLSGVARRWRLPAAYGVHAVVGTFVGLGWTLVVSFSLGPWFRAFSFPVAPLWIIAAGLAFVGAVIAVRRQGLILAVAAACLPILGVAILSRSVPPKPLDMIVSLKAGLTSNDGEVVWQTVLSRPHESGRGYRLLTGIESISQGDANGVIRFHVTFHRGVDEQQRQAIRQAILSSDLIAAVEDVKPSE